MILYMRNNAESIEYPDTNTKYGQSTVNFCHIFTAVPVDNLFG